MKRHVSLAATLALAAGAAADTIVVTQNAASAGGSGAYSTILNSQPRSWLTVIGEAELSGRLPIGAQVTGVSWRNASWQAFGSWPANTSTFNNFDIYLCQSARTPGNLDTANITNNFGPDLTTCRAGTISFPPGYFQGGAVSPAFNPFCAPIQFTTPYTYQGGPLLILVRHTGNNAGNGNLDWVASQYGTSGAQGISVASYTSNTGWGGGGNGGAVSMQFTFTVPVACYANCDSSTTAPVANVADFTCFLQKFAASDPYANCDASTTPPTINVADFTCFLQKFASGCP